MQKMIAAGLVAAALAGAAGAQPQIDVRTTAQVLRQLRIDGKPRVTLVPADRVVAGDPVVYTLAVRNVGAAPAAAVVVTTPIPPRMRYLAGSAAGPGARVSFSVDGGRTYDAPAKLTVLGRDGKPRAADAADYTNIRWLLQDQLQAGSVAFVRFRAVLR
ncbi:MAG: DUF11 domain-containing protein [Gammaproteobacteria bacterium]|nr:DUF11 domain-containing protein [Gammaproteobacteria bacterium]